MSQAACSSRRDDYSRGSSTRTCRSFLNNDSPPPPPPPQQQQQQQQPPTPSPLNDAFYENDVVALNNTIMPIKQEQDEEDPTIPLELKWKLYQEATRNGYQQLMSWSRTSTDCDYPYRPSQKRNAEKDYYYHDHHHDHHHHDQTGYYNHPTGSDQVTPAEEDDKQQYHYEDMTMDCFTMITPNDNDDDDDDDDTISVRSNHSLVSFGNVFEEKVYNEVEEVQAEFTPDDFLMKLEAIEPRDVEELLSYVEAIPKWTMDDVDNDGDDNDKQGSLSPVKDEYKCQDTLRKIRKEYNQNAPRSTKHEKHLDHCWMEFGELLKAVEVMLLRSEKGSSPAIAALEQVWQRLAKMTSMHDRKSEFESAQEIVGSRQKRRKLKHFSKTNKNAAATEQSCSIEPWHIVLGDHSARCRTFGTLVLRYYCVEVKHDNANLDTKKEVEILRKTRDILKATFPDAPHDEVGKILYMAGKKFTASKSSSSLSSCRVYSFEDDKASFVPVQHEQQLEVVKHLYTKITPSNERSLQEVADAYRTLLDNRVVVETNENRQSLKAFVSLLDFCGQAESLALTQTAINGLRESLDYQWAELVPPRRVAW